MNRRFGQPRLPRGILHTLTEIRAPSPTYDAENGGQWVPGTPERIDFEGCVLPVSEDDWKTAAEGTYKLTNRFRCHAVKTAWHQAFPGFSTPRF